jgi:hypothetical protein
LDERLDRVLAELRYKDIAPRKKKLLKFLARQYLESKSTIQDIRRVLRTLKYSSSPGHQLGGTEDAVKEKIKKYIKPYSKSTTPSVIDGLYNRFINQQARQVGREGGGGGGGGGSHTPTFPLFYTGRRVRSGYQQFQQDEGFSSSTIGRGRSTDGDQQLQRALRASIQTKRKQDLRHPRPPHAGTAIMTLPLGGAGGGVGGTPFTLRRETTGGQKVGIAVHTDDLTRDVQSLFTNPEFSDQKNFNDEILRLVEHYKGKYAGDIMEVINTTIAQKMKKDIEQMLFTDLTNIIKDRRNNYPRYIIELGKLYTKYRGKDRELLVKLIGQRLAREKQKVEKQLSKQASRRLDGGGGSSL